MPQLLSPPIILGPATLGISGSRSLTPEQEQFASLELAAEIGFRNPSYVVTGGCIGVDALAARLATRLGYRVHAVLPSDRSRVDPDWADFCYSYEEVDGSYYDRNARLVDRSAWLIALPERPSNGIDRGSGTWMTIRIAHRAGTPTVILVLPEVLRA